MLTFTPPDTGLSFSVDYDRFTFDRWEYRWTIAHADDLAHPIASGSDLKSGCTTADNPERLGAMLASLLGFLSAFAESLDYESRTGRRGENGELFPPSVAAVFAAAGLDSDQLALWADEVSAQ